MGLDVDANHRVTSKFPGHIGMAQPRFVDEDLVWILDGEADSFFTGKWAAKGLGIPKRQVRPPTGKRVDGFSLMHADGDVLVRRSTLQRWALKDMAPIWGSTELFDFNAQSTAFSPDGQRVAAGDAVGMIRWLRWSDGALVGQLAVTGGLPKGMAFSHEVRYLAVGASDGVCRRYDLAGGSDVCTLGTRLGAVVAMQFPN